MRSYSEISMGGVIRSCPPVSTPGWSWQSDFPIKICIPDLQRHSIHLYFYSRKSVFCYFIFNAFEITWTVPLNFSLQFINWNYVDSSFKLFSAVHKLKCDACKVFNDGYNCNLKDRIYIIQWKTSISSLIILQKKRKLARWLSNIKYILSKYLLGGENCSFEIFLDIAILYF